jgi:iron complex outermembrane receptor protein
MPQQLFPNQRMDLLDNEQVRVAAEWKSVADWGRWEAGAYYETVDHYMDFGPDKRFWYGSLSAPPVVPDVGTPCAPPGFMTCAAGMPMYSEGDTAGADLKTEIDLANEGLLRVGAEYRRYRLDDYWPPSGGGMWPGTFHNINDGRRDRHAVYAEWESVLGPRWLAQLGARYERVISDAGDVAGYATVMPAPGNQIPEAQAFNARDRRQTDDNLDLTALARYAFSDAAGLEFGVARKVRSPNLYERYTWSTWAMPAAMNNLVGDGNGYVGDIGLQPEVAYTASLTFDWHATDRAWELRATPYFTLVDDYIDAVALPGWAVNQFNVLRYANQAARIFGIDFSGEFPLMENRSGEWKVTAVVAWTDGENRDTGDALYNIMPLNGRFTLGHRLRGWDNSLEWVVVDAKDELSQVRNEIATSGYGLFNLRMGHEWKRFRVDGGIENIFDRFYTLPTGGAYLGQGTTMVLNAVPWGTGVPGMGRSFYAGFTIKFE